jgi:UDP-glucose 4-epimerase
MLDHRTSCVVFGGGGFIGINLCRRLVAMGCRVRAYGRRCAFPEELQGIEWYQGDFSDATTLASAMESFDVAFHLVNATTPQSANLEMPLGIEKDLLPSLALFEIARKLGLRRLVYVSSGGTVYGCPAQIPTPETAPTNPITAYGINKLAVEKYLALYEYLHGLDYRVLRVSNPFGPFQTTVKNQGIIAALISRGLRNEEIEIWGDGTVVRDFIFIDDVVDALIAAADDLGDKRIFNIGSGEGRSLREVMSAIERHLGVRINSVLKPGRALDVPVSILAIDQARDILRWTPKTTFDTGLDRTISWWRSRGNAV